MVEGLVVTLEDNRTEVVVIDHLHGSFLVFVVSEGAGVWEILSKTYRDTYS